MDVEITCTCQDRTPGSTRVPIRVEKSQPQVCKYTPVPAARNFKTCKAGETADPISVIIQGDNCPFQPQIIEGGDWFDLTPCGGTNCNSFTPHAKQENNSGVPRTGKVKISDDCIVPITQPECPVTPTCPPPHLISTTPSPLTFTYLGGTGTILWSLPENCSCTNIFTVGNIVKNINTTTVGTTGGITTYKTVFTVDSTSSSFDQDATVWICLISVGVTQQHQPPNPPQTCNDPDATNNGQVGQCTYAPPSVDVNANPANITAGNASTLSWTYSNAHNGCTMSGDWSGNKPASRDPVSGSQSTGTLTTAKTYSYTLTCSGKGGSRSDTATVTVTAPPPTLATLSWRFCVGSPANLGQCNASGGDKASNYTAAHNSVYAIYAMINHAGRAGCTVSGSITSNIGSGSNSLSEKQEASLPSPIWLGYGIETNVGAGNYPVFFNFVERCSGFPDNPMSGSTTIVVSP
jgi:hypothetical protein